MSRPRSGIEVCFFRRRCPLCTEVPRTVAMALGFVRRPCQDPRDAGAELSSNSPASLDQGRVYNWEMESRRSRTVCERETCRLIHLEPVNSD